MAINTKVVNDCTFSFGNQFFLKISSNTCCSIICGAGVGPPVIWDAVQISPYQLNWSYASLAHGSHEEVTLVKNCPDISRGPKLKGIWLIELVPRAIK